MTKEEIQKNGEHWYNKYKEVKHELEQERKLNVEIKARFVKCNTCTDEMKSKCLMFSENLCEGERCEELEKDKAYAEEQLDEQIQATLKLQKENAELKADNDARKFAMAMSEKAEKQLREQIEKMKCCYNCSKWYDGEFEESPKSKTFFCADFKCDNWEFAND